MTEQSVVLRKEQPQAVTTAMAPDQFPVKPAMTPAQAKVDAIANLTMAAYERAATLQLTDEQSKLLQQDFPNEAFKTGAAGKENLIYIEHAYLRDRFNQVFGLGQWAIIPRSRWAEPFQTRNGQPGERVYVEAMLVIRGAFVGEAIGAMEYYKNNEAQNYSDAVEGAKTAAFRRCAKEFGVGLQAWKKDFCDAWHVWNRERQKAGRTSPLASQTRQAPPPAAKTPPPAQDAPKAPPVDPKTPTDKTRVWMIEQLNAGPGGLGRQYVEEFFRKAEALPEGVPLEELPLQFVPMNKEQVMLLVKAVEDFSNGEPAALPFKPHIMPPKSEGGQPATSTASQNPPQTTGTTPTTTTPIGGADEWFLDCVVPIPRKGMKRNDYLKAPDTIRSLYEARHDDEEARKRLFGFAMHWQPEGWTKRDGTQMPPSETDVKFREALDAFVEYYNKENPDKPL